MGEKIYLIYNFYEKDADVKGYIQGNEEDAKKWCEEYNAKREWQKGVWYKELENLTENNSKE